MQYATLRDEDPIPWLTTRWIALGGPIDPIQTYDTDSVRGALGVLNAIVAALGDDARPYSVSVGSNLGASTDLKGRSVQIGLKPLSDPALSLGQRVAITVGLAYHEVAHIRHTRKTLAALDAFPGNADAQRYSNIAEDVRAERLTCIEFPGLADTLPVTLGWVGEVTVPVVKRATSRGTQRAVGAVRYADRFDWTGQEADLAWWQAWGERAAEAHTIRAHEVIIQEALDHAAQQPPLPPDEPPPGPKGKGEGKGDESQPGEGSDEPGEPGEPGEGGEGQGNEPGESEPGEGMASADGNGQAAGGSTDALPECPSAAAKRGDEERIGEALAAHERSKRGEAGTREYGGRTVKRAYQSRRGITVREDSF